MSRLTEREQAVWDRRNAGFTFKQIAEDLGLCVQTVSFAFRKAERYIQWQQQNNKPTEVDNLKHELEVYKRAFKNEIPTNYYELEKVENEEQYIDLRLDQARKELEDERDFN